MNTQDFYELIEAHIVHAKEKHPAFPPWTGCDILQTYYNRFAKVLQDKPDQPADIIMFEEAGEFLVEYHAGNFERAKEEAGDLIAVLFRMLESMKGAK